MTASRFGSSFRAAHATVSISVPSAVRSISCESLLRDGPIKISETPKKPSRTRFGEHSRTLDGCNAAGPTSSPAPWMARSALVICTRNDQMSSSVSIIFCAFNSAGVDLTNSCSSVHAPGW